MRNYKSLPEAICEKNYSYLSFKVDLNPLSSPKIIKFRVQDSKGYTFNAWKVERESSTFFLSDELFLHFWLN